MPFWSIVCSFLGLAFAAEAMGLLAHELNLALSATLLVIGAILGPRSVAKQVVADRRLRWSGAAAVFAGLILLALPIDLRFFAAALWFWGLDSWQAARSGRHNPNLALASGCVIFAVYLYLTSHSLLAWHGVQLASLWVSTRVGGVAERLLELGPTFSGLGVLVLALSVLSRGLVPGAWRRKRRFAGFVLLAVVMFAAYLWLFAELPASVFFQNLAAGIRSAVWLGSWRDAAVSSVVGIEKVVRSAYPVYVPAMLPILLAIPVAWCLRGSWSEATRWWLRHRLLAAMTPILCATGAALMLNAPAPQKAGPIQAALYEKGFLNWMVPTHERYGSKTGGMFGNLPILLKAMGWEADLVPEITAESLSKKDILVLINQMEALSAESIGLIDQFVKDGGGLLVMSDHTFWKNEKRLVGNDPIKSTNIRIEFDSADFFIGGWLHSEQFAPHQITAGLSDEINEAGVVVGASLRISYPAAPLVVGRYGYSDPGVPQATDRGYLGNLDYDPGEQLGDVVLVAAQNVGRGRVVVCGDTSSFVNGIQIQTWPFVQRIFHWLGGEGRAGVAPWRDAVGMIILVGVAMALVARARAFRAAVPIAALSLLGCGWAMQQVLVKRHVPGPLSGRIAVIDASHIGRYSMEGWNDNAISGVFMNLMREGYFPIALRRFDEEQIRDSELFVSIAPTRPYSPRECEFLRGFMEAGGTVLLCVGYEERLGSLPLLEMFGLEIPHRPLGRGAPPPIPGPNIQPQFWEAWPVSGGETLVTLHNEPVVVRQSVGLGQLLVIGDTKMLFSRNFESEDAAVQPNIRFFTWLLGQVKSKEGT